MRHLETVHLKRKFFRCTDCKFETGDEAHLKIHKETHLVERSRKVDCKEDQSGTHGADMAKLTKELLDLFFDEASMFLVGVCA